MSYRKFLIVPFVLLSDVVMVNPAHGMNEGDEPDVITVVGNRPNYDWVSSVSDASVDLTWVKDQHFAHGGGGKRKW